MSTLNNNENIGVIYVMKCLDYIKIGKAKIGSTRFGEYTRLMSKPEYILRVIVKNYHDFEKEIHKKYENYRTNGEWYLFNKNTLNKVVSFIKSHSIMNYNETDEFEFDANQIKIVEKGIIDTPIEAEIALRDDSFVVLRMLRFAIKYKFKIK